MSIGKKKKRARVSARSRTQPIDRSLARRRNAINYYSCHRAFSATSLRRAAVARHFRESAQADVANKSLVKCRKRSAHIGTREADERGTRQESRSLWPSSADDVSPEGWAWLGSLKNHLVRALPGSLLLVPFFLRPAPARVIT